MRELIRLKPFAAVRGSTLQVWTEVAESLSRAIGVTLNVKQIRDRLTVLKGLFKSSEAASALGSGVEESLDAINVQSHYDEREGLVREYTALESLHKSAKRAEKQKKHQKEEDLARCADEIVRESSRRRSERITTDSDDCMGNDSDAESISSAVSSRSSSWTSTKTPKRPNAFQQEVERQVKRQKQEFELKERELAQSQLQFEQRLALENKQAEDRLRFEERVHTNNRELILECAKLFSAALAHKDG